MICTKTETRPAHGILAMLTIVFILGVSGKDVLSDELKSVGQSLKKNILIIAGPITGHGKNAASPALRNSCNTCYFWRAQW